MNQTENHWRLQLKGNDNMLILDRIDEETAVIESDSGMIEVSIQMLGENICEGDVLIQDGERYIKDEAATAERKQKIAELYRNRLKKRGT